MKKIYLLMLANLLAGYSSYAQNTFPATGNVGVGTSAPGSSLEVRKDVQGGQGPVLELTNGSGSAGATSEIFFSTYGRGTTSPSARIKVADNQAWGGNFYFDTKGNGQTAGLGTRLFIQGLSGNIGVGNLDPKAKLDVSGPIFSSGGESHFASGTYNDPAPGGVYGVKVGSGGIAVNGNSAFVDGSVSIGTMDPKGYKLAVAGNVVAESVTVKLKAEWPDYVFKGAYHLPSLTEVKTYIDKHQHLPGMPSEQEVANEGVNLGEMNKLLVKKVEELTLYLIEKDKKDQEKDKKLEMHQSQLQVQEQRIKRLEDNLDKLLRKR